MLSLSLITNRYSLFTFLQGNIASFMSFLQGNEEVASDK